MSESSDWFPYTEEVLVAAAGTRMILKEGRRHEVMVKLLKIKALTSNGGKIYYGGPNVASTNGMDLDAGDSEIFESKQGKINLSKIWLDADNNGEGVRIFYLRK